MRDQFIGRESYRIFRLKQEAFEEQPKTQASKNSLKNEIIQRSLLAKHLKEVYESFAYNVTKRLYINNWIQLMIK
jgi:hypothetical protein